MNTTMYFKLWRNNDVDQAVGNDQGLDFCVHIFDGASDKIVVSAGLLS